MSGADRGVSLGTTRTAAVLNEIRRRIIAGDYAPGTALRQTEIAEAFGVSTTPVREAFAALAQEGFVIQESHRGVVVFEPSVEDMRENYEIRAALESLAGGRAATRISDEGLLKLEELLARMNSEGREDPVLQASELNPRFHAIITEAAERPRLATMIGQLRSAAIAYQLLLAAPGFEHTDAYKDAAAEEHGQIVAALRARDPELVEEAIKRHVTHNLEEVVRQIPAGSPQ